MKLCDIAKMKIDSEYNWNEFEKHYYCDECSEILHSWAWGKGSISPEIAKRKAEGLKYCPNCLNELTEITDEMIKISKEIKDNRPLVFTPEERKEIFDDWKKSIKKIPTWEAILKRQERAKKPHQTFASA